MSALSTAIRQVNRYPLGYAVRKRRCVRIRESDVGFEEFCARNRIRWRIVRADAPNLKGLRDAVIARAGTIAESNRREAR